MTTPDTEKRAPVQGYPGGIPWAIHLEAYEVYCKRWGAQPALVDLEGRNCRGGFGTGELDDFIPGWRDRVSEFGKLKAEVLALRAEVAALKANAARYLWLRDVSVPPHNFYLSVPTEFDGVRYAPADVDSYIDKARAA